MQRAALYTIRVEAVNPYHYLGEDGTGLIDRQREWEERGEEGERGGEEGRGQRRGRGRREC